jgi:hypothetical protein
VDYIESPNFWLKQIGISTERPLAVELRFLQQRLQVSIDKSATKNGESRNLDFFVLYGFFHFNCNSAAGTVIPRQLTSKVPRSNFART